MATRLPADYRLPPTDATTWLRSEIVARLGVPDLPSADRVPFLGAMAQDGIAGGQVIVTDNRRHFLAALRHGIRVETAEEFAAAPKRDRASC